MSRLFGKAGQSLPKLPAWEEVQVPGLIPPSDYQFTDKIWWKPESPEETT